MSTKDRSIGLSDLASRAQAGPVSRQRSNCRNLECVNGMTPGLNARGGGTKGAPLFGAGGVGAKRLMHWAWVPCLACNATDDQRKAGAKYRDLQLTEVQIAQRAQMANVRAAYQPTEQRPPARTPYVQAPTADSGKLTELIEQNKQLNERLAEMLKQNVAMTDTLSRMSMQVASLLADNAELRNQAAKSPHPVNATTSISRDARLEVGRVQGTLRLPEKPIE